jgi:predicted transcriptional regulator
MEQLLAAMAARPGASFSDLASALVISRSAIAGRIRALARRGKVELRNGHWRVAREEPRPTLASPN